MPHPNVHSLHNGVRKFGQTRLKFAVKRFFGYRKCDLSYIFDTSTTPSILIFFCFFCENIFFKFFYCYKKCCCKTKNITPFRPFFDSPSEIFTHLSFDFLFLFLKVFILSNLSTANFVFKFNQLITISEKFCTP